MSSYATMKWPSLRTFSAVTLALPIAVPIIAILLTFLTPSSEVWSHLRETVLSEYVLNTSLLLMWVGLFSVALGTGSAWIVAMWDFPCRKALVWALILPISAPAYVAAYAYADLTAYAGFLQSALRDLELISGPLPSIRSLPGAGFVLSVTLYPYIYLFAYNAFREQSRGLNEAARTLGASQTRVFFRIALPHARPAIIGGLALVLMETAADFGVVEFFGLATLTNGIFRTWYAQGEHLAAMQLAGWLFLFVALLVIAEQIGRRGSHANPVSRNIASAPTRLVGIRGFFALCLASIPVVIGFIIPVCVLLVHAAETGDPMLGRQFSEYFLNSIAVAAAASVCTVVCAIWLIYTIRTQPGARILKLSVRVATLGYAIPGMVLAVGLIGPMTSVDKWIADIALVYLEINIGLLLTGSIAVLIFVYLARFLTVAFNSCDGGMSRIHPNYDAAARSLGVAGTTLLRRVHLPIMTPSILTALLLVFVDVIKELPATLILRPFNFETLATRTYRLASDERIAEASTAALTIVLVGLIPAGLIAYQNFARKRHD